MLKAQKKKLVEEISNVLKNNDSFIFFSYNKLTSSCFTNFKLKLKQGSSNVKVVKNTLANIAAEKSFSNHQAQKIKVLFKGNSMGIIYGEIGFCAKELGSFAKDNTNSVSIIGGIVDGEVFYKNDFEYFANPPSKQELKAKLNKLIASPVIAFQKTISMPAIAIKKLEQACKALEI